VLFDSLGVLRDRSPGDHELSASACARRRDLIFRDQPTNSCKWDAQYSRGFMKIDEKCLLFGSRRRRASRLIGTRGSRSKRSFRLNEYRCGAPIVALLHVPIILCGGPHQFSSVVKSCPKNKPKIVRTSSQFGPNFLRTSAECLRLLRTN
jgi:hypothetical protein